MSAPITKRRLMLVRTGWVLFAAMAMLLFVLGTIAQNQRIRIPCKDVSVVDQPACWPSEEAMFHRGYDWDDLAAFTTVASVSAILPVLLLGWVIFWRISDEKVGLLISSGLIAFGSLIINPDLVGDLLFAYPDLILPTILVEFVGLGFIGLFPFMFPDGRFVPRHMQLFGWLWIVRTAYVTGVRIAPDLWNETVGGAFGFFLFPYLALNVYAMTYRYRFESGIPERQKIKLVVFGFAIGLPVTGLYFALSRYWNTGDLFLLLNGIVAPMYYLAILFTAALMGISILRYQLFDIDLIIRRTLQYSVLTGILAVIYYFGIIFLWPIITGWTGKSNSTFIIVVTTLLISAIVNPLRSNIQNSIDRKFYRTKYDAELALARFAATARNEVDLDQIASALFSLADETIQPDKITLALKLPSKENQ